MGSTQWEGNAFLEGVEAPTRRVSGSVEAWGNLLPRDVRGLQWHFLHAADGCRDLRGTVAVLVLRVAESLTFCMHAENANK